MYLSYNITLLKILDVNSQQPKYYNTSAFLGSGTYGPLVRPPSPPPPLAEAEQDDDLDNTTYSGSREAEVNYLSTLGNSTETGEHATAETQLDDYLEPRANGKHVLIHFSVVLLSRSKDLI